MDRQRPGGGKPPLKLAASDVRQKIILSGLLTVEGAHGRF